MRLVSWSGDRGILTETRSDDDGGIVLQKAIDLPEVWSFIDPIVITVDEKVVEVIDIFEVEPDGI